MCPIEKYRILCSQQEDIPIFNQAWWLDSVAPDGWDVVIYEENNKIIAALPYVIRKKVGVSVVSQPKLTPHLGPWIRKTDSKRTRTLAYEKKVLNSLYSLLPNNHYYNQNWNPNLKNWLPLYWKGYSQTTNYTYRINDLTDLDSVFKNFDTNIRTDIRKAEGKFDLNVKTNFDLEDFLDLNEMVFQRQSISNPYDRVFLKNVIQTSLEEDSGSYFVAYDNNLIPHAGVFIVWDKNTAYYVLGGGNPKIRNSGATSLCLWSAIQFSSKNTYSFDFEGSMLEPIDKFFRAFGGEHIPYFNITKRKKSVLNSLILIKNTLLFRY